MAPEKPAAQRPFPPRGAGVREGIAPNAGFQMPHELSPKWDYQQAAGGVLLGEWNDRKLGWHDDRHMVTIAGSRAGKSWTVLIPNLQRYPGPAVVIDPKGELYEKTAKAREDMGHKVYCLNPFSKAVKLPKGGVFRSHAHNPMRELARSENLSADAAQLADALIINDEKDSHWTDSAKNLLVGLMLHAVATDPENASILTLRKQVSRSDDLYAVLTKMIDPKNSEAVQNAAFTMRGKFYEETNKTISPTSEMRSIMSTAGEQTRPLDDVAPALNGHDFWLDDLTGDQPITIYLVLPALRIATHHRWLRLFIYQVLATLERKPIPRGRLPLWLVLEEFAALGNLRSVESAAGYMAGFGVKLWAILQDLTQLRRHYPNSWETFLGNAGLIQAFGNSDATTTKYLSALLGETRLDVVQESFRAKGQRATGDFGEQEIERTAPLLAPAEITLFFSRETWRQLVLVPGEHPAYFDRLEKPKPKRVAK